MTTLAVTNTSFPAGTTAVGSQVSTNFTDIVNYINNRNAATATWDQVSVSASSGVALTVSNSTGTSNIANFQDNGSNVFTILDGATSMSLTSTGLLIGSSDISVTTAALRVNGDINVGGGNRVVGNAGNNSLALSTNNTSRYTLSADGTSHLFTLNSAGSAITLTNENADNTNAASHSKIQATSNGASSGDASFSAVISGVTSWSWGADNSDSDAFVLSESASLGTSNRLRIASGGGLQILGSGLQLGAPTGGDKGSGTINVASDIYKNNTAYNNPDYVFELWTTGKIEKFKENSGASDYTGPLPLENLVSYCQENLELPRVKSEEGQGIFERADRVLEKLEEAYLYIFGLHERIKILEGKVLS